MAEIRLKWRCPACGSHDMDCGCAPADRVTAVLIEEVRKLRLALETATRERDEARHSRDTSFAERNLLRSEVIRLRRQLDVALTSQKGAPE